MRRIGIFGGTFDPVHLGHLIVAEQCREQASLDQVWFLPSARPPHKLEEERTPFARRVEMLQLAIAGQPAFRVEELEKDRPGPSFTADTLDEIAARQPDLSLHFILGSDSLQDLPGWYEPVRILSARGAAGGGTAQASRCVLAGGDPPGHEPVGPSAPAVAGGDGVADRRSSTDLRRRAAEKKSLRFQVPRRVECYIEQHRVYG